MIGFMRLKIFWNDKLTLVFMKVVTEGYNVRIITVKRGDDYFVLDGHHHL